MGADRELIERYLRCYNDKDVEAVVDLFAEDAANIALEIDFWCRLAKDLPDGRKAGQETRLRGASFFTIRNGRIARLVDYM